MVDEGWLCPSCGAHNQTWRHWCQSCSLPQDRAVGAPRPAVAEVPAPTASPASGGPTVAGRRRAPVLLVSAAAMLLVSVAVFAMSRGGSGTSGATAQVLASDEPASSTTTAVARTDAEIAKALLWSKADFPDGWSEAEPVQLDPGAGAVAGDTQDTTAACAGATTGGPASASLRGPDLTRLAARAAMSVAIMPSADTVKEEFATASAGGLPECVRQAVIADLGGPEMCACQGITVTATPLVAPLGAPEMTYAFRVAVTQRAQLIAHLDAYLLGQGRAEVTLVFGDRTTVVPFDVESEVVAAMGRRLNGNPTG